VRSYKRYIAKKEERKTSKADLRIMLNAIFYVVIQDVHREICRMIFLIGRQCMLDSRDGKYQEYIARKMIVARRSDI